MRDVLLLGVILLGPAPWCLALAGAQTSVASRLIALLASWCVLETAVALGLGMSGTFHLPGVLLAESALFGAGLLATDAESRRCLSRFRPVPRTVTEWLLLATAGLGVLALSLRALALPINDHDSLAFHLPVMAKWYQAHRFEMLEPFYEGFYRVSYYPHGWEALAALFLLPFGEDFAVALPNVVAWAILGLSTYRVARALGAHREPALIFALLLLTTPIVREHVMTMHVDLPFGAFFMAALALALDGSGALLAAMVGLLLGTKSSGIAYAPCLVAVCCWVRMTGRTREVARRARVAAAVALAAGAVAGLFWYARNIVATGNPLGFIRVTLAGRTFFAGAVDSQSIARTTLWWQFHLGNATHWHILADQMRRQLGLPFLLAVVAAWVARGAVRPRTPTMQPAHRVLLVGLVGITALAYWTTPSSGSNGGLEPLTPWMGQALRYAFPLMGLVAVSGSLALSGTGLPAWVVALPAITCAFAGMSNRHAAIAAAVLAVGWATWRVPRGVAGRALAASTLIGFAIAGSAALRVEREAARREKYHGFVEFIDRHVGHDQTLAYLFSQRSYLLYGTHLDRRVAYMPAGTASLAEWIDRLREAGVALVGFGPTGTRGWQSRERAWLEDPSGAFERVFGRRDGGEPTLYRLRTR